jgi:hypothetical protein
MNISTKVKLEIAEFLRLNIEEFQDDALEYGGMDITFAINDDGDHWNYQTGDNSFTGSCYGLPHWAVTAIEEEDDVSIIYDTIIEQLDDALNAV